MKTAHEIGAELGLSEQDTVSLNTEFACIELMRQFNQGSTTQGLRRYVGGHKSEAITADHFLKEGNLPEICRKAIEEKLAHG